MTNVPAGAAELLAFIRNAETGESGEDAYRTIIRHKQGELSKPVTAFTVDELLAAQVGWGKKWKSSAAGAYQIIRKTLATLKKNLKLSGAEKFTPELQDQLGFELMRGRGWDKAVSGRMSADAFALELAREWASMPVLKRVKGQRRWVERGESYYAGDGLNKSLVSAATLEVVLGRALGKAAAPAPATPVPPLPGEGHGWPEKGARDNEIVAQVQRRLKELGYVEIGNVDGDFGSFTEKAILNFRHDNQLPLNGRIDNILWIALPKAQPRPVPAARENAPPSTVRERAPEAKASWWSKIVAGLGAAGTAIGTGITWIVGNFDQARSTVKPIADLFGHVPIYGWLGLLAAGFVAAWFMSRKAEHKAIAAYQAGERR